jgi:2,5-diketo-D-gluconate reductase B
MLAPTLQLTNTSAIPILGFGTWALRRELARESVEYALEIGYRHIDTADAYENHEEIGKAIKNSKVPREEIFIVTKLWSDSLESQMVLDSTKRFLEELQTEYIDLLLIHRPGAILVEETLNAMQMLKNEGLVKALGVSNFGIYELKEVLETGIEIDNNQIDYHPSSHDDELVEFCQKNDISVTAYSPFGVGKDLEIPEIQEIAKKYNKSPAQIILKWILSKDLITIPRSGNKEHIKENFEVFDWKLEEDDVRRIDSISSGNRVE